MQLFEQLVQPALQYGTPPKVLIIEEDSLSRQHLLNLTLNLKCNPIELANPRLGADMAQRYQPNLILSSLVFRNFNSLELLSQLRCTPVLSNIPLIAVTSLAPEEYEVYWELGVNGFLAKPITLQMLSEELHSQLARYRNS